MLAGDPQRRLIDSIGLENHLQAQMESAPP